MNGVTQVVGLWPNREPNEQADDAPLDLHDFAIEDAEDESSVPRDWMTISVTTVCTLAAVGWLVWLGMIYAPRWMSARPHAAASPIPFSLRIPSTCPWSSSMLRSALQMAGWSNGSGTAFVPNW